MVVTAEIKKAENIHKWFIILPCGHKKRLGQFRTFIKCRYCRQTHMIVGGKLELEFIYDTQRSL
jgi:hypothetical protein